MVTTAVPTAVDGADHITKYEEYYAKTDWLAKGISPSKVLEEFAVDGDSDDHKTTDQLKNYHLRLPVQ